MLDICLLLSYLSIYLYIVLCTEGAHTKERKLLAVLVLFKLGRA